MNKAVYSVLTSDAKTFKDETHNLRIPRKRIHRVVASVLTILGVPSFKHCQKMVKNGRLSRKQIKYAIEEREKKSVGRPCYLSKDEEAIIVAVAELKGAHSLPSSQKIVGEKLHVVLQKIGKREEVQNKTKLPYARRLIHRVN